jgi:uncharacterized protein
MRPSPEKKATFRFYEELNDFLPSGERKKDRIYGFKGTPSVKDAIEAQNIPHTEVDLILVNGYPVKFTHKLKNGDHVSVYPVFESFDISAVRQEPGEPLRKPSFILDVHLGKLTRLLRMTGFDSYYRNDLDDSEIIVRAEAENRIILTRDLGILKNSRVTKGYYIRSQIPGEQLKEVINRFQLRSIINFFRRCMECNGEITETAKADIENDLKPGTRNFYEKFFRCRQCGKIYWEGSHFERMRDLYGDLQ